MPVVTSLAGHAASPMGPSHPLHPLLWAKSFYPYQGLMPSPYPLQNIQFSLSHLHFLCFLFSSFDSLLSPEQSSELPTNNHPACRFDKVCCFFPPLFHKYFLAFRLISPSLFVTYPSFLSFLHSWSNISAPPSFMLAPLQPPSWPPYLLPSSPPPPHPWNTDEQGWGEGEAFSILQILDFFTSMLYFPISHQSHLQNLQSQHRFHILS